VYLNPAQDPGPLGACPSTAVGLDQTTSLAWRPCARALSCRSNGPCRCFWLNMVRLARPCPYHGHLSPSPTGLMGSASPSALSSRC